MPRHQLPVLALALLALTWAASAQVVYPEPQELEPPPKNPKAAVLPEGLSVEDHEGLFAGEKFSQVMDLNRGTIYVRDRTAGPLKAMTRLHPVWRFRACLACVLWLGKLFPSIKPLRDIGRHDEHRPHMYDKLVEGVPESAGFEGERNIHMGVDIGGPPGEKVYSFANCTVYKFGYNPAPYDYGHVIVTEQKVKGRTVWALYGHLSAKSMHYMWEGKEIKAGELIGYLGNMRDNGGWPPHLHFMLSLDRPATHDLPGVVSKIDHKKAQDQFPDPRLVLGELYKGEAPFWQHSDQHGAHRK